MQDFSHLGSEIERDTPYSLGAVKYARNLSDTLARNNAILLACTYKTRGAAAFPVGVKAHLGRIVHSISFVRRLYYAPMEEMIVIYSYMYESCVLKWSVCITEMANKM
jgi:hypothetical protein